MLSMNKNTAPQIIGWKAAAELTGLPRSTLYELASRGQIPHLRINGCILRFDADELVGWLTTWRRGPRKCGGPNAEKSGRDGRRRAAP